MTPIPAKSNDATRPSLRETSGGSGSWSTWSAPVETASPALVALVPHEGVFEGQLVLAGTTLIEGVVRGSLRGSGELVLGPDARVEGVIECDVVTSRGQILGSVVARRCIRLAEGARMDGDLQAPAIEVADDVVWNGRARVGC